MILACKHETLEIAQKCINLGADINYMEQPQGQYMVSLFKSLIFLFHQFVSWFNDNSLIFI